MLHRTVWDAPSASSKREVSFRLETGGGYVTPICMECAVRQFDKEVSFKLGKGQKYYIELYGTRRAPVRKKKLVLNQKQNKDMLHQTVWDAPSASSRKKLVLDQEQEQNMLHGTVWEAPSASSKKKLVLDQEQQKYFLTDTLKKSL